MSRALARKKTLLALGAIYLIMFILGICFVKTPAFYSYHLNMCDRYLSRVCYSERSVFVIFLERTAGCAILALLISVSGIHIAGLVVPPVLIVYRAYTFGGSLAILLTVYRVSGILVAFVLYLPIRLLTDAVLLLGTSLSFGRAPRFCFGKEGFSELGFDFLVLLLLLVLVCLAEMLLLLAVFHPVGNLL